MNDRVGMEEHLSSKPGQYPVPTIQFFFFSLNFFHVYIELDLLKTPKYKLFVSLLFFKSYYKCLSGKIMQSSVLRTFLNNLKFWHNFSM